MAQHNSDSLLKISLLVVVRIDQYILEKALCMTAHEGFVLGFRKHVGEDAVSDLQIDVR